MQDGLMWRADPGKRCVMDKGMWRVVALGFYRVAIREMVDGMGWTGEREMGNEE
jgi:hypothetical protein